MKYFLDTEFIEGFHKPLFGKKRHFIDLVSIGVVAEDGREFYAISNEFNYADADTWVKSNVLDKLVHQYVMSFSGDQRNRALDDIENKGSAGAVKIVQQRIGSSNEAIQKSLLHFFGCWRDQHFWRAPDEIEVYGYFADYDWVLFSSLFGRMVNLPKGFPFYCMDLKQMMQERGLTKEWKQEVCPDPEGEHNALVDAKWNMKLYNAIMERNYNKIKEVV